MKTLAISSQKGGVGKTTLSLNLGFALAARGQSTLLVDCDTQGAIGLSLLGGATPRAGFSDWLEAKDRLNPYITRSRVPEFSVLTIGRRANEADGPAEFANLCTAARLEELKSQAAASGFDIVLFDTPAGLIGPTDSALGVSDAVVVPLQAEPLGLRTLPQTLRVLSARRAVARGARLVAIVPTMVGGDAVSKDVLEQAQRILPRGLLTSGKIVRDPDVARASAKGVPVALLSRNPSELSQAFASLAVEIEDRLDLPQKSVDDDSLQLLV